ncbi:hypothetical protein C8A05DRAFT_14530, partial [Staphylotrichum tortipilum]
TKMTPQIPYDRLVHLYKDLTHLSQIASSQLTLHPAFPRNSPPLVGLAAAQAHVEALVGATNGTLVMRVDKITVGEDGVFGCVIGVIEAGGSQSQKADGGKGATTGGGGEGWNGRGVMRMPFCGLWRFDEKGMAVEHWENAADPEAFGKWLIGGE